MLLAYVDFSKGIDEIKKKKKERKKHPRVAFSAIRKLLELIPQPIDE